MTEEVQNPNDIDVPELKDEDIRAQFEEGLKALDALVQELAAPVPPMLSDRMGAAIMQAKTQVRTELARVHGSVETFIGLSRQYRRIEQPEFVEMMQAVARTLAPVMMGGPNAAAPTPNAAPGSRPEGDEGGASGSPS